MSTTRIRAIHAWEILDSRGRPTVAVRCELDNGVRATAHAPSGASTGRHEAVELRDGDPARYGGYGVLRAVENAGTVLAGAIRGIDALEQAVVDQRLLECDGTPNKARLGANAILAISCAVARAAAVAQGVPLWQWLAGTERRPMLPVPMVNILSGGLHAGGNIEFQDFLVIPEGIRDYRQQLEAIAAVHRETRRILEEWRMPVTGVADEGGWGPRLQSNEAALQILTEAIERVGRPLTIALDVAASHFHRAGKYELRTENRELDAAGMTALIGEWTRQYPIRSVEDPLEEDDWAGWAHFTAALGERLQIVGDDFFTTNLARLNRGVAEKAANAVLVKMNQIGTLTETLAVVDRARQAGYRAVISARSGETEDTFLADLATASGAGQIKVGSITRSERLAKYNRLLEICGEELC